jgi:hypothetical protein
MLHCFHAICPIAIVLNIVISKNCLQCLFKILTSLNPETDAKSKLQKLNLRPGGLKINCGTNSGIHSSTKIRTTCTYVHTAHGAYGFNNVSLHTCYMIHRNQYKPHKHFLRTINRVNMSLQ